MERLSGIFAAIFVCFCATAQTGAIEGIVQFSVGPVCPVVLVRLQDTDYGTYTDEKGAFGLSGIPVGTYQIRFQIMVCELIR